MKLPLNDMQKFFKFVQLFVEIFRIYFLFCIVVFLQKKFCFSKIIYFFQPYWIYLLFMYFVIFFPKKINANTGFFLGLMLDFFFGSTLGVQSIILLVLTCLLKSNFFYFFNTCLFNQTMYVIFCFFIFHTIVFIVKCLLFGMLTFNVEILLNILVNGLIWPFFSFFLKAFLIKTKLIKM